jgi:hypothetical protein
MEQRGINTSSAQEERVRSVLGWWCCCTDQGMLRLRVALLMRKKQRKIWLALMAGEADLLPNFYWENYTLEHVCDGAIPTTCHSAS